MLKQELFILSNLQTSFTGEKNLHSAFLKKNIGKNYKRYIESLIQKDLIEKTGNYYAGNYSNRYKLTRAGKDYKIDNSLIQDLLIKMFKEVRISRSLKNQSDAELNLNTTLSHIASKDFQILRKDWKELVKSLSNKPEKVKKIREAIKLLRTESWSAIDSDNGNRIYTILSNCPKELRNIIRLKHSDGNFYYGTEFDITNAQPFFLADYLSSVVFENVIDRYEVARFYEITKSGKWNQYVSEIILSDIKTAKQLFMSYVFSKSYCHSENGISYNERYDKLMQEHFPSIHKWILSNNFNNELSILLRASESKWSHSVIKSLRQVLKTTIYSVHDCIIVPNIDSIVKESCKIIKESTKATVKLKELKQDISISGNNVDYSFSFLNNLEYISNETIINSKISEFYKDFSPDSSTSYNIFSQFSNFNLNILT